jgi:hypothetical protein
MSTVSLTICHKMAVHSLPAIPQIDAVYLPACNISALNSTSFCHWSLGYALVVCNIRDLQVRREAKQTFSRSLYNQLIRSRLRIRLFRVCSTHYNQGEWRLARLQLDTKGEMTSPTQVVSSDITKALLCLFSVANNTLSAMFVASMFMLCSFCLTFSCPARLVSTLSFLEL